MMSLRGDIIDVVIWADGSVSTEASLTYCSNVLFVKERSGIILAKAHE